MFKKMNRFTPQLLRINTFLFIKTSIREFRPRKGPCMGKPPWEASNIEQIMHKLNKEDDSVHYLVDIGLPYSSIISRKEQTNRYEVYETNKKNKSLQREARNLTLTVPLDEYYEEWLFTDGPRHIRRAAEHYSIYEHLFGDAYFYPVTPLSISFKDSQDEYTPVYFGNTIKPKEAKEPPLIDIGKSGNEHTYYTLVLSSLDSHLCKEDGEYVHWFVGNIPDGDITKGEVKIPYLQPFPTKGTGYHRYAFILYQHEKSVDYSKTFETPIKNNDPNTRTFNTYNFYRKNQEEITPSGLAFFQCEWDSSVQKVFHEIFNMDEPRYEYDFPEDYENPPLWFPIRRAFNTYLDRYRDPKQISKEVLEKKLKWFHPFKKPEPPFKYPHVHTPYEYGNEASWIQVEAKKEIFGWGKKYNDNKDILDPQ